MSDVILCHRLLGLVDVADGDGGEGQVLQRHVLRVDAHDHGRHAPFGVNVHYEECGAYQRRYECG